MKLFAITPDNATVDQLVDWLPELQKRGADFLYIRLSASGRQLLQLIDAAAVAGIVPIVPYALHTSDMQNRCGVHYKSCEASLFAQGMPPVPKVITASCHSRVDALLALHAGASYAFVSPVYAPLSKHGDRRRLFPRDELRKLITMYGERIVFLGGITTQRLMELVDDFNSDFSAAGITLFFDKLCT
jgi:thiamine monophosphate synthase